MLRRWIVMGLAAAAALAILARPVLAQATLSGLETDLDLITRAARPSVVTVLAQRTTTPRNPGAAGARRIHTRVGSGVALEPGLVLTTATVVVAAERVLVRMPGGSQAEGEVVGTDLVYNIALIRVGGLRLPPIALATRRAPQEGDWVIVLGTSYRGQPTQSVGNIATIHPDPRQPLLQLTNTVYPGNSGGAALNARGELIGIVQGELGSPDRTGGAPDRERRPGGLSFVQPLDAVRPALEMLRRDGRVRHGFLGVSTRSASVESDTERGLRVPIGALVENVRPDGPAMKAGLRPGDLIVGFDRERVEYADQLARWISASAPNSTVDLVWVRDEIQQQGKVVLTESPDAAPRVTELPGARSEEASSASRIADLERQIQELTLELKRLKDGVSAERR